MHLNSGTRTQSTNLHALISKTIDPIKNWKKTDLPINSTFLLVLLVSNLAYNSKVVTIHVLDTYS